MAGTSDKAVIDYLDTLFLDVTLPPVQSVSSWVESDSIDQGNRLQPCSDIFSLMSINNPTTHELWQGFLQLLVLGSQLPRGQVQSYVFLQSQVLFQKAREKMAG
ncbi:hypothetical protein NBRC116188_16380 [Oceaniserpentilla sp. 4NH20-0058]|uniref:hypothetical protein n=1 Tax=Oceaniserpentilla sp. 4NH20-0058 TaxID=3127660 RepID=UPI0031036FAF